MVAGASRGLGFAVAPETRALMRVIVDSGELATIAPERVWQELARGLMEAHPSRMLEVLRECGGLAALLPEFDALFGIRVPARAHPERDAGQHLLLVADREASRELSLGARYAALAQNLGAGTSPSLVTRATMAQADAVSSRLKVPTECRDAARLAARWHRALEHAAGLTPAEILSLLLSADALRRPERLATLLDAAAANVCVQPVAANAWPAARLIVSALERVKRVDAASIARSAALERGRRGAADETIAQALREARLGALRDWKRGLIERGRARSRR